MKSLVTYLTLIVVSISALAAERTDTKLAMEYLEVSQFEQVTDASIEAYSRQFFKDVPAKDRESFEKIMRDTMGWEAVKHDLAALVASMYSRDELKAFLAFARTRHGASFNAKSTRFSDAYALLLARNLQRVIEQCPLPSPNPADNAEAMR